MTDKPKGGRPKAPERPPTVGWRPETPEQRAMWFDLGGGKWVRRLLNEAIEKVKGK